MVPLALSTPRDCDQTNGTLDSINLLGAVRASRQPCHRVARKIATKRILPALSTRRDCDQTNDTSPFDTKRLRPNKCRRPFRHQETATKQMTPALSTHYTLPPNKLRQPFQHEETVSSSNHCGSYCRHFSSLRWRRFGEPGQAPRRTN